jgi:hypothetical protein
LLPAVTTPGFSQVSTNALPESLPAGQDVVQLKNGSRIIGEAISIREGELHFDAADCGDVVIKVRHVARLVTRRSLFRILLVGGEHVPGSSEANRGSKRRRRAGK